MIILTGDSESCEDNTLYDVHRIVSLREKTLYF